MDRGALQVIVHGVAKSQTRLKGLCNASAAVQQQFWVKSLISHASSGVMQIICIITDYYVIRFPEIEFSSVHSLSRVRLFVTPWIAALQASLSTNNSRSLLKFMPTELVMPSSHLIHCRYLLLLPPIPPSIRVFSNESLLHVRWSEYWSFSFSISLSNE